MNGKLRAALEAGMAFFGRTAGKMSGQTTLLLPADPGDKLFDAARLYDPEMSHWHDRLVFYNGVLLFGPVRVTPKIEQQAGLPAGMAVAWYTGAAGGPSSEGRSHEDKLADGERLVRGLAVRLGGTTHPAPLQPRLSLRASVYSEQGLTPEQVVEVLQPLGGGPRVEERDELTYAIRKGTHFDVAYLSPQAFVGTTAPAALGKLRSGRRHHLHNWELLTAVQASRADRELCLTIGEAALALAGRVDGVVLDQLGFRVNTAEDMLLR
jgi:hypothetical protein